MPTLPHEIMCKILYEHKGLMTPTAIIMNEYIDERAYFKHRDICECVDEYEMVMNSEYEGWCEDHEQIMWKNGLKCGGCLEDAEYWLERKDELLEQNFYQDCCNANEGMLKSV